MNIGLKILKNTSLKLNKISNSKQLSYLIIRNNGCKKLHSLNQGFVKRALFCHKNDVSSTSKKFYTEEKKESQKLIVSSSPIKFYIPSLFQLIFYRIKMFVQMKTIDPSYKFSDFIDGSELVSYCCFYILKLKPLRYFLIQGISSRFK